MPESRKETKRIEQKALKELIRTDCNKDEKKNAVDTSIEKQEKKVVYKCLH